jgi:serine protease Do
MGIGFAIPINLAASIKDQLIEHGRVRRSVLGIFIQEVDEDLAASFGLEESGGILISQVIEDSAAEKAGLQEGDIVVEMNGRETGTLNAFRNRVASTPPETEVELRIFRDGEYRNIVAVTRELGEGGSEEGRRTEPALYEELGLSVEDLSGAAAQQLDLEEASGVLITEVEQGRAAWRAGLSPGQVITSVNRRPIDGVAEFMDALNESRGDTVLFLVTDGRSSRFVVVTIE